MGTNGRFHEWIELNPLRQWRKKQGISVNEAALRFEVSRTTVANWEAGVTYPSFESMAVIEMETDGVATPVNWVAWKIKRPERRKRDGKKRSRKAG